MPGHYHERHMPHWQPEGAALFLTWRSYGSLRPNINLYMAEGSNGKRFATVDQILGRAATGPQFYIKNFSARQAEAILHSSGPCSQHESHDRWRRDHPVREKIIKYIEGNPVAAGLIEEPEDFQWSSGRTGREACPTETKICAI